MPDHRTGQTQGHDQRDRQGAAGRRERQAGDELGRFQRRRPHRLAARRTVRRLRGAQLRAKLDDGERHPAHRPAPARIDLGQNQQAAAQILRQGQLRRRTLPHHQRRRRHRPDARPVPRLAHHLGDAVRWRARHDVLQQRHHDPVRDRREHTGTHHHDGHHEILAEILRPPADGARRRQRPHRGDVRRSPHRQGVQRRGRLNPPL